MALAPEALPELSVAIDQVCFVIVKARALNAKDVATLPDSGSNAIDDGMTGVLEDAPDDATVDELRAFIDAMDQDARLDLLTLAWIGRGDGAIDEWDDVRLDAVQAYTADTFSAYLLGLPLLADYLEEGLTQLGRSCAELDEA